MFKRSAILVALTIALTSAACQPVDPLTEEDIATIRSLGAWRITWSVTSPKMRSPVLV